MGGGCGRLSALSGGRRALSCLLVADRWRVFLQRGERFGRRRTSAGPVSTLFVGRMGGGGGSASADPLLFASFAGARACWPVAVRWRSLPQRGAQFDRRSTSAGPVSVLLLECRGSVGGSASADPLLFACAAGARPLGRRLPGSWATMGARPLTRCRLASMAESCPLDWFRPVRCPPPVVRRAFCAGRDVASSSPS